MNVKDLKKAQASIISDLLLTLTEIANRGPIKGYTSAGALLLRLVATQSLARSAIEKAKLLTLPNS